MSEPTYDMILNIFVSFWPQFLFSVNLLQLTNTRTKNNFNNGLLTYKAGKKDDQLMAETQFRVEFD